MNFILNRSTFVCHGMIKKGKKIVLTVSGNGCPRVSDTFHMVQVERSQSYDGH